MTFSLSFAGVRVNITSSSTSTTNFISGVRHCDGRVEADVCNLSGTIIISQDDIPTICHQAKVDQVGVHDEPNVVVDAIPEVLGNDGQESRVERSIPFSDWHVPQGAAGVGGAPNFTRPYQASPHQADAIGNSNLGPVEVPTYSKLPNDCHNEQGEEYYDAVPESTELGRENAQGITGSDYDLESTQHLANPQIDDPFQQQTVTTTDTESATTQTSTCSNLAIQSMQEPIRVGIDSDDDAEKARPLESGNAERNSRVRFSLPEPPNISKFDDSKMSLHRACASEFAKIDELRALLRADPKSASIEDEFGDYPAHIFAHNDALIFTMASDEEAEEFITELYDAYPPAFSIPGYSGEIPFAAGISDWIDSCHQIYTRGPKGILRESEIRALTKSTRVISSLCVREDVQRLMSLPDRVMLTPKAAYSFRMLSVILDKITDTAHRGIPSRREFYATCTKRRDKIIKSVASLPFLIRTILLIDDEKDRNALFEMSIVRNAMFSVDSVGLWLVALLSGDERAKSCATHYLCRVSRCSLPDLLGNNMHWCTYDIEKFKHSRAELYKAIGALGGIVPCLLHLGDQLYEVSTRRAVKYIVEGIIGRPLPVYLMFMETIMILTLMTSYRIIIELIYSDRSEIVPSDYREYWGLAMSIAAYFVMRDLAIMLSFSSIEATLLSRYVSSPRNIIGLVSMVSILTVLGLLYVEGDVQAKNFLGVVSGLLWLKFVVHIKGMSEHFSTLINSIIEIAGKLRCFLGLFFVAIFFFSDMIEISKKATGQCDGYDADSEGEFESFCSSSPIYSYLSMYGIMIGGFEVSSLEGASPYAILIFLAGSFCGVIVLVNILIAIVTDEYEKANERSCMLFARSRLEAAARFAARERIFHPPSDPTLGRGIAIWRFFTNILHYTAFFGVETFLIQSLMTTRSLESDGVIGEFLFVSLILCAVLHHMFLVSVFMYKFMRAVHKYESLYFLRNKKIVLFLVKITLKPVCLYLSNVGLGNADSCMDQYERERQQENSIQEFLHRQVEFENNVEASIRASEQRILRAIELMMVPRYSMRST